MIHLRPAVKDDIDTLNTLAANEAGYFERCFDEGRLILLARKGERDCGYGMLNFAPRYALYRKMGYPEIQDVNVHADCRREGIATQMIVHMEQVARDKGYEGVGISVGITREFGPAQRLYVKLGYEPDGFGVTIDRESVDAALAYHPADLCLMMLKRF